MSVDYRSELRAQHRKLRDEIARTRSAALSVLSGGPETALHQAVASFQTALLAHLADEEKLLLPVLAKAEGIGPLRIELLRAEHAHQRAVFALLAGTRNAPRMLAKRAITLCADVLLDMEFEESEVLGVEGLPARGLP